MVSPSLTSAFLVDANLRGAMRCYALATAAGEARDYDGIVVSLVGTRLLCVQFRDADVDGGR